MALPRHCLKLHPLEFARFAAYIRKEIGIHLPPNRRTMLEGRLAKRLRALNMKTGAEYWNYLMRSPEGDAERAEFFDAVTTNKTNFFREPAHFDQLVQWVIPEWRKRSEGRRYSVWCAACSSGEEAYTLGMVLMDVAAAAGPGVRSAKPFDFDLLASDISTRMLRWAIAATYHHQNIESVPMEMRKRYLLRSKDSDRQEVRIAPILREKVTFRRINLMDSSYKTPGSLFDAVFLRNILIYFERQTQIDVLGKILAKMHAGGHLFVGHADSLLGMPLPIKLVAPAVYEKTS